MSAAIGAPAERVYRILADYHDGHPRILPPQFSNLTVEQGGYGAGTVISFGTRVFGVTGHVRSVVTEPQPGRVLVETDLERGTVTSFTVDPRPDGRCEVTIRTDVAVRAGFGGAVEGFVVSLALPRIYAQELDLLSRHLHAVFGKN